MSSASLERGLDAASLRHQVIAHNVANANTPGFKRSRVEFEAALRDAIRLADRDRRAPGVEGRIGGVRPAVVRETTTALRNDGNNVDIEAEMAALSENSLWYQAMSRQLGSKIALLRLAITEGRR